jgi:hypothetical protein
VGQGRAETALVLHEMWRRAGKSSKLACMHVRSLQTRTNSTDTKTFSNRQPVCCATRQAWDAPQHESRPHTHPRLRTHTLKPAVRFCWLLCWENMLPPLSRPSALDADKPWRAFAKAAGSWLVNVEPDTTRTSEPATHSSDRCAYRIAIAHTTDEPMQADGPPALRPFIALPPCLECMMRAAGRPIRPSRRSQYASCLV